MKCPHTLFLAIALTASSQAAAGRNCRIVFPDRPPDAPKFLHLFDGKTSREVELPSMNLSPVYELAEEAVQLKLLAANPGDAKQVPADVPTVDIPAEGADVILVVSSDPENKVAPIKLQAIELDGKTFKPGQILWSNHSDMTIGAKLGGQTVTLEPESSKVVDSPLGENGAQASGHYNATFTYKSQPDGAFEPITEQQWWHDGKSRQLGFIFNTGGKLPQIYFYRDFRLPEE